MRFLIAFSVVSMWLAGCSGANPQTAEGPHDAMPSSEAPHPTSNQPPADVDEIQAPKWDVGDWWTWVITTQDLEPFEVTTTVTSVTDQEYRVGIDDLDNGLQAFAYHALPMGVFLREPFQWEVHDHPARVVTFPLTPGSSWTGEEEQRELRFTSQATTVSTPAGDLPAVEARGVTEYGLGIHFVYLPAIENFASYSIYYGGDEPYATSTWIANGTDGTRATVVESDDAFITFTAFPPPPHVPTPDSSATFEVPATANTILLACSAGGQGAQRTDIVSPSGTTLSCGRTPDGPAFSAATAASEAGTWVAKAWAAGGYIEAEVYALTLTEETF